MYVSYTHILYCVILQSYDIIMDVQTYPKRFLPELNKTQ